MSIKVAKQKDADGTFYEAKCECGKEISTYVQRGTSSYTGIGDLECECGKIYNCFGQAISHPQGRGFDYCGEYDDEQ